MGFNLTGTQVKNTYQKLTQISGSYLTNGTGSVITNLNVIASNATQAVNAYTASYALYAVSASYEIVQEVSSSYAQTAGFANSTQWSTVIGKPTGLVSGSGQIVIGSTSGLLQANRVDGTVANAAIAGTASAVAWSGITSKPSGLVSGSSQITLSGTTGTLDASRVVGAITASAVPWTGLTGKPAGIVSGSAQINVGSTTGTIDGSRVTGTVPAATLATNVAWTGVTSKPAGLVSSSVQITLQDTTYTDGLDKQFLQTNGAGDLAFADVATIYENIKNGTAVTIAKGTPLYASGSNGANVLVFPADAANPAKMPALYIAGDDITAGATGRGAIMGLIEGIDLTGYTAGQEVYVAAGGGWTATRPTGTAIIQSLGTIAKPGNGGKGIILNSGPASLPNIASGHFWVGNGTATPTATSTGSFAKTTQDNIFSGNQTFNNITVNGTGSFAYLQQVTGSVKRIGDAFIQVNTDSPSQRFGGLKVVDSGSLQTGSIMWDSQENHWIYENTAEGAYKAGGFLAGPRSTDIYNVQYPTVNKVLKGQGGDHVTDSSITDTGVKVDFSTNVIVTGSVVASTGFTGNLAGTATSASYVSGQENFARKDQANTFTQRQSFSNGADITGSLTFNSVSQYEGIDLMQGIYPSGAYSTPIRFYSGSIKRDYNSNKWINMQVTPGTYPWLAISSFPENAHFMYFQPAYTSGTGRNKIAFESEITGYGNGLQIGDNVYLTGSLAVSSTSTFGGNTTTSGIATQNHPSVPVDNGINTIVTVAGNQFANVAPFTTSTQAYTNSRLGFVNQTRGSQYRMAYAIENYNNTSYNNTTWGSGFYSNGRGHTLDLIPTGSTNFNNKSFITLQQGTLGTTAASIIANSISLGGNPSVTTSGISLGNASLTAITMTAISGSFSGVTNSRFNNVRVNGSLNANAAVTVGTTLGVTGATTLSSTLDVSGKTTFNDQVVAAVQTITPASNTGSLDCSLGNFFTMTLGSGDDTLLNPSNIHAGQTINVQITQNSGTAGTISFPSSVKFAGGTDYTASTGLNAVDVLTLISFDGTSLLATSVKNLS